jgi:hypothetical protein
VEKLKIYLQHCRIFWEQVKRTHSWIQNFKSKNNNKAVTQIWGEAVNKILLQIIFLRPILLRTMLLETQRR